MRLYARPDGPARGVAGVEYVNLRNRNGRDKYMPVDCIVINEARNNINASAGDVV